MPKISKNDDKYHIFFGAFLIVAMFFVLYIMSSVFGAHFVTRSNSINNWNSNINRNLITPITSVRTRQCLPINDAYDRVANPACCLLSNGSSDCGVRRSGTYSTTVICNANNTPIRRGYGGPYLCN